MDDPYKTEYGVMALYIAARQLNTPAVKLLLEKGSEVNAKYSIRRGDSTMEFNPLDDCYKSNGKASDTEKLLKDAGAGKMS